MRPSLQERWFWGLGTTFGSLFVDLIAKTHHSFEKIIITGEFDSRSHQAADTKNEMVSPKIITKSHQMKKGVMGFPPDEIAPDGFSLKNGTKK